jgi:hypothetical protein
MNRETSHGPDLDSDQNHRVSATVDRRDPDVFTFHQHIVTANLPTCVSP